MFIRYSITAAPEEISERFSVDPGAYTPRFNAAPSHLLPVITHDSQKGLSFFYWGAPPSMANKKALGERIINTRLETIREKAVVRKKLTERRCLVPADGFFAWKRTGKRTSIPYRYTLKDKSLFSLAGLWDEYDDENGEMNHTFTIITLPHETGNTAAEDRQPALLSRDDERKWLEESSEIELTRMLKPYPEALDFYSVSSRVNSPDKNDKLVILPAPPADQFGNLSLFD